MALTGRKPIPAALIDHLEHKKNAEDIRIRKEVESSLQVGAKLRCPKEMSPIARKEWRRMVKLYRGMESEILNDLDVMALMIYCEAVSVYKKAHETWLKYQQVVAANPDAQRILDKCFTLMERQTKIISSYAEQLCLTPVGRARMGMGALRSKEKSEIDSILEYGED